MANVENETLILINDQDMEEGFFEIGTSRKDHYEKILKRVGGAENLVSLQVVADELGKACYWNLRIPKEMFSKSTFGLKSLGRIAIGKDSAKFLRQDPSETTS